MIAMRSGLAAFAVGMSMAVPVLAVDQRPQVIQSAYHGVSPAMRDIVDQHPPTPRQSPGDYVVPNIFPKTGVPGADETRVRDHGFGVQRQPSGTPAPEVDLSVLGLGVGNGAGGVPPDTNGDVSATEYVQWINTSWAVFRKSDGVRISGPTAGNSFWSSFPVTSRCRTTNAGDPLAIWDDRAERWLMSQFTTPPAGSNQASQCVAVSQTADPLGAYHLYEFQWPAFGDYPHFGIWDDETGGQSSYVLVTHEFNLSPVQFLGAAFILLDRERMLAGEPATAVRFSGIDAYGAMPAHLDGSRSAPASSCPAIVHFAFQSSEYRFWDLCADWQTPANSSLSSEQRLPAGTPFEANFTAVPQLGSAVPLDSFGSNIMYRASAWANPPGAPTTVSLVINHAVRADETTGAVRWVHFDLKPSGTTFDRVFGYGFEARQPSGLAKAIVQEGAYAPDEHTRWMGGIAIDQSGNIGLGYNVSSATLNPKLRITGRSFGDPAGELRAEQECAPTTTGSQTGSFSGRGRWGDYASMSVDPVDECTFWFTGEYYATTSTSGYTTRICTFKFDECGQPDFALVSETPTRVERCAATEASDVNYAILAASISGYTGTVTLDSTGLPAGLGASFSNGAQVEVPTVSVLQLTGVGSIDHGEYLFQVTGDDGNVVRPLELQLGISAAAPEAPATFSPNDGATGVKIRPRLSWLPVAGALLYTIEVATDAQFTNLVVSADVADTSWASTVSLASSTEYFWRVRANNYCGDGAVSAVASFTTGIPGQCPGGTSATIVFEDDFQNGANGWVAGGTGATGWSQQTPSVSTGLTTTVWGIPNNAVTSDRHLLSPPIAVPSGAEAVILSYDVWHRFETDGPTGCWDGASLEASTDAGDSFDVLSGERMLTDPYTGLISAGAPLAGREAWCASTALNTSLRSIVDLDDFAGQTVQLRWRASTDSNTTAPAPNGYYFDNLRIEVCQ